MKMNEMYQSNPISAGGSNLCAKKGNMSQKSTNSKNPPKIQFQEILIGGYFESGGRRY